MSGPGLCKYDNIKRIITLTVITLSGTYCVCNIAKSIPENGIYFVPRAGLEPGSAQVCQATTLSTQPPGLDQPLTQYIIIWAESDVKNY